MNEDDRCEEEFSGDPWVGDLAQKSADTIVLVASNAVGGDHGDDVCLCAVADGAHLAQHDEA